MSPSAETLRRFSVVTAVRNGMPMIRGCVASVQAQGDHVREHLVQDALSTDGTTEWCRAQRGLALRSEADAGMYDAINRGWAVASGEFLSWLNADEQYLPDCLAEVARAFDEHPDVDAIFGDAIIVDPDGYPVAYRREPPPRGFYIRNSFLYVYSCTLFYRRRLWDEGVLKLEPGLRYAADMDLILRLLKERRSFLRLDRPLALYTASGQNLSTHGGMQRETLSVCLQHGGLRSPALRRLSRVSRWLERLCSGGFARRTGSYPFHVGDGRPPVDRDFSGLGSRYSVFDERRTQDVR